MVNETLKKNTKKESENQKSNSKPLNKEKIKQRANELNKLAQPSAPSPLQRKIPKAKPFPFELLSPVLGNASKRMHQIVQCPDAICGQSTLAAAGLAAQALPTLKSMVANTLFQ
jgi:hypothetical protein